MVDETETNEDGTTTVFHCDPEGEFCESNDDDTWQACKTGIPAGEVWAYTVITEPGDPGRICPSSSVDVYK